MMGTQYTALVVAPSFNKDNTTFEEMILGNKSINL